MVGAHHHPTVRPECVVRVAVGALVVGAFAAVGAGYVVLSYAPGLVAKLAAHPLAERCPDACATFVEEPGLFYLYGVSSIGAAWVATRVGRHWRFDVGARGFVPRERPLRVEDGIDALRRALGRGDGREPGERAHSGDQPDADTDPESESEDRADPEPRSDERPDPEPASGDVADPTSRSEDPPDATRRQ